MIETMPLEVCADCLVAVLTGRGDTWRINLLFRKFRGGLIIAEQNILMTFRQCGACNDSTPGVRYEAVAVLKSGEHS